MSERTEENKGKAKYKKAAKRAAKGAYWVEQTVVSAAGLVYKNFKAVKFTRLDPVIEAMLKAARKVK